MLNKIFTIFLIMMISHLVGQTNYTGFIGKQPIEIIINILYDNQVHAIYAYKKYHEPINLTGSLHHDTLKLVEDSSAVLTFNNFTGEGKIVKGIWKSVKTKKQFEVSLNKDFELEHTDTVEYQNREILQSESLKNEYFKLSISKNKGEYYPNVNEIKIYNKKTDSLVQQFDVECELDFSFDEISINDYNLDGYKDFSVFEARYANGSTSRIYFLFNPETKKFYDQGFAETNLEFYSDSTIHSENSCCGHSIMSSSEFKLEGNKLILIYEKESKFDTETFDLIEEHCFSWDKIKDERIEIKCK